MKHTLVALSLIALCTPQITYAMETNIIFDIELKPIYRTGKQLTQTNQLTTNNQSLDELISTIDATINEKYIYGFLNIFSTQLTEQNFLDIINIITDHSNAPSSMLINKLHQKNNQCKQAIEHFCNLARQNIDNVTIDTLETIQNPTLPQPTTQLNKLPTQIKSLFMNSEYNKISCLYKIPLEGHTKEINFFDICPKAHLAATSSLDKTLRLWDLNKGELFLTFPGTNNIINCLSFNPDGSHLVTAENCYNNACDIKVWETKSGKLLHTTKINQKIATLNYGSDNTIIACEKTAYRPTITVFLTTKDAINVLSSAELLIQSSNAHRNYQHKAWHPYSGENPYYGGTDLQTLKITKQTAGPLYLYNQIVKNTQKLSSDQIEQQPLFQKLTEYEQNIITASLQQRPQANKLLTNK